MIDDGSTDSSPEICLDFASKDFRFRYVAQKNLGASAARNYGNLLAQGEYVTYVDSDDYIDTVHLARLITGIVTDKSDMAVTGYVYESEAGRRIIEPKILSENMSVQSALRSTFSNQGFSGIVCNKLFKLSVIRKFNIKFDANIPKYEDHLFCVEYLLKCNKVRVTCGNSYHYIKHEDSALQISKNMDPFTEISTFGRMQKQIKDAGRLDKKMTEAIGLSQFDILINDYYKVSSEKGRLRINNLLVSLFRPKYLIAHVTLKQFIKRFVVCINMAIYNCMGKIRAR